MFADRTNWNLTPNRLSEALARRRAAGQEVLDLSASNPTATGLGCEREELLRALANPAALRYEPHPLGIETARLAIADYYRNRGVQIAAAGICLTAGTSEAYSFLLREFCNPGDEILVPAPSYPLFDFLAEIQDVRVARYPLVQAHGWQIDFAALEQAIGPQTRALIVVHPNNPTGHFCKPAEMARLEELCASRRIALIADEVFLDFSLADAPVPSFAALSRALTFTLSGLSKMAGLPQMKAAWMAVSGPEELRKAALERMEVIADTYLSVNTPVQLALREFLDERHGFVRQVLARVRTNLAEIDRQLAAQKSCSRLEMEGGWYAVLRVPATRTDEELAIELLETRGVYLHPGHFYDFPRDGFLVLSLIAPEEEFAEGCRRLLLMF